MPATSANPASPAPLILVATRKGAWLLHGDAARSRWRLGGPHFLGHIINHVVLDPRDAERAWVFPMDGQSVWPRTSPDGKPAVYATRDGGESWQRQDAGLPREQAWWTVKRQAMCADAHDPVGLYFGTTSGELWASADEGASWTCIARHLPEIYAVEACVPAPAAGGR